MKRRLRLALVPALALALLYGRAQAETPKRRTAESPDQPPRLAILISVDGLSWARLSAYRPWYTAGLKRLFDEGFIERSARYHHLNTETGPGHASLGTGNPPRVTGIVANRWFTVGDDGALHQVYCTDQVEGGVTVPGPAKLQVPTLGDRLVAAHPEARVVSISGKDRGAIFLAGKDPRHAVYWFDTETGRFVTSSAYGAASEGGIAGRRITRSFNARMAGGMLPGRFGLIWKRLAAPPPVPPAGTRLPQPAQDLETFQVPANGLGLEHDLSRNAMGYFNGFYYSPLVDELTMDLALSFLEDGDLELGHREGRGPDLLCLSFSGQDTVSHNYGNESEEDLDVLRRLDLQLGRLFAAIDENYPAGSVVVGLSADHGFAPIPEVEKRNDKRFTGGRLVTGREVLIPFAARLNRLLDEELCLDTARKPIGATEGWDLFYDHAAFPMKSVEGACGAAGRSVTLPDLDAALPRVVTRFYREEVKEVLLASRHDSWPTAGDGEFARNDYFAGRSGDAVLIPNPGVLMHWDPGRGSGHGSQYESDIHVPLIFWGDSIPAGGSDEATAPYDLAPTLARILGVPLPDVVGRALTFHRK